MAETNVDDDSRSRKLAYLKAYREANSEKLKQHKRANYLANRDKIIEKSSRYYKENREAVLKRRLAAYAANPEPAREDARRIRKKYAATIAATKRAKYAVDPTKGKAASKKWALAHPQQVVALAARHRAKRLSAEGSFNAQDVVRLRKVQKDRCAMPDCRAKLLGKGVMSTI